MAAIFGVIAISPRLDIAALAGRIQSRLAHRAPDGFTRWKSQGCLLGHGALHLTPGAIPAVQPLQLADGRVCVADGYVANPEELRAALGVDRSVRLDDSQWLALAIERWGDVFAEHVHGEFAVALWDPRARRLELVRDHLGARPLCYVQTPDMFAFASTSLALAGLPGVPARLDPLGIVTMWYDDAAYLKADHSAFESVAVLAPAHRLVWNEVAGPRTSRYWRLQPELPLRLKDGGEYVEAFQEVFGGAVSRALRDSPQSALMLSGGIDSAAILAARQGFRANGVAEDLICISAVTRQGVASHLEAEDANIRSMTARHSRNLQFEVPVGSGRDALVNSADLAGAAWSWIHPADASLLVPSLACQLARSNGCRLILNGVDGDNVTSAGRYYIDALVRDGQMRRAWRESRVAGRVNTYLLGRSPAFLLLRAVAAALEPRSLRGMRHLWRTERMIRGLESHPEMAPVLAQRTDLPRRLREATQLRRDDTPQWRCDHLTWWLGFSLGGSESIVSRHGLEVRHPWGDLQVLRFFQRLPLEYRTRDGWTKWVVRKACEPALGADVVWHSGKAHLGSLLTRQVVQDARTYLDAMVDEQRHALAGYVRKKVVSEVVGRLANGSLDDPEICDRVLKIAALAGWLRYVKQLHDPE